jgi:hypothetical protein
MAMSGALDGASPRTAEAEPVTRFLPVMLTDPGGPTKTYSGL